MKNNQLNSCLMVVALSIAVTIAGYILSGIVLAQMWSWFIVPTFGAPSLSIALAIGVTLITRSMTWQLRSSDKKDSLPGEELYDQIASLAGSVLAYPLLTIATAWIVYQFV